MGCKVPDMLRAITKNEAQKNKVYTALSETQQERFKNFIGGLVDIVSGINEEIRGLALYDKDLFKDTNTFIKNITAGAYSDVNEFLKTADATEMNNVYRKTNHYMESVIGLANEPRKTLENRTRNIDALKVLKFHTIVRERTHANKIGWNPLNWFTAPNLFVKDGLVGINKRFEYLIHRDPMFRELKPANDLKIQQEYVENSASKFAQAGRLYIEKIINEAGDHRLFDRHLVNVMIKYMDPYQSVPNIKEGMKRDMITLGIKSKLHQEMQNKFTDQFEKQENKEAYINELYKHLKTVQGKFNLFNYGVEDPYFYNGGNGGDTYRPITKADLRTDKFNKAFEVEGTMYPPLLKMMLMNGEAMYSMLKGVDITRVKADGKLYKLMDLFKPTNGEDDGFKIRMNYIPSSKEDDIFGEDHYFDVTKNEALSSVSAKMLTERTKWYKPNAEYTLSTLMNNNLKIFKFYNSIMSDYIMTVGLDHVLNTNKSLVKKNNEPLYDSLRYFTDRKLLSYESKGEGQKEISVATQTYKTLMYSLIGLAVAGRLTTSAVTNRLGGFFTSMTKMSPKEQKGSRDDWNEYENSNGIYGELIKVIKDDEEHKAVKDKISDVIREENFNTIDKNNKEVFKNLPMIIDRVSTQIDMGSDRLMNQFLGIMPKAWKDISFSGSENAMLAFTSKFIFHDLKAITDQKIMAMGFTADNIPAEDKKQIMSDVMQHYNNHKDYYYNTIKEMIGSYSKSTKPLWQSEYMKNANTKLAITLGATFLMHGIFKQVSANNNEALNRLYAGLGAFNADMNNPYAKGAYSSAGLGGVFLLAVYNYLIDEELNYIKQLEWAKRLPRVYSIETVNLLGEKMMTVRAMKSAIRYSNGANLEDSDYRNLIMAGKFIGGIPLGRGMGYYEAWMEEGKYKSMKNVYGTAESIIGSFVGYDPGVMQMKGILDAGFADNLDGSGMTMKQRKSLADTQFRKGLFYADQSNDVLKLIRDVIVIGRGLTDLVVGDNDKVTVAKFNEYVFETLRNTAGLSYYMPKQEIPWEDHKSRQYNRYNKFIRLMRVTDWESKKGNYAAAKSARDKAYALRKVITTSEKNVKYPNYKLREAINELRYNNYGK